MAKYLITLVVLCIFGATLVKGLDKAAVVADFMGKADACKAEVGSSEGDLADMVAENSASTAEGKCLRACIMKKYGVLDGSGKLITAVAEKHAEFMVEGDAEKMKVAKEIIDICTAKGVPGDHCEAAETYLQCFKAEAASRGIKRFEW